MGKGNYDVTKTNKGFTLRFGFKGECSMFYVLSAKEWENLIGFLKTTKTPKGISKDYLTYWGYEIDSNKIKFGFGKSEINILSSVFGPNFREKEIEECRRELNGEFLEPFISFEKSGCTFSVNRELFLRFREYCLSPESVFDIAEKFKKDQAERKSNGGK